MVLLSVFMVFLCFWSSIINAENEPMGACFFLGLKKTGSVGKTKPEPDGAPNAVFSVSFTTPLTDKKIEEIEIKASNPSKTWTSHLEAHGSDFLGVAFAKNPSDILNRKEGELKSQPLTDSNLLLFVIDDGLFSRQKRKYQIRVLFTDGTAFNKQAQEASGANPALEPPPGQAIYPVRMSAFSKGISNYDAVGFDKKIQGGNKPNALFELKLETKDREITALEIRNIDEEKAVWDTVPTSHNPPVGVALKTDPTQLINEPDGSLKFRVKDKVDLNLYVADNGVVKRDKTDFRINVAFSDGQIYWTKVEKSPHATKESSGDTTGKNRGTQVNFLGEWLGFVPTNAVGPYPEIKPDGKPDSVFGLDIDVNPKSTITGIEINSVAGVTRKWGTHGTSQGAWGLAIAYQKTPTALLNKPDGSISIPIEGRTQFYIYAYDPGDLAKTNQNLRIIVRLADGSYYQQMVKKGLTTTSSVVPEVESSPQAKGLITCEFRGFLADLVNTSNRPGKSGYLNGTFIMKFHVEDKKLRRVDLAGPDGEVRWSSDPKASVMFLGVALYPKIYQLINAKAGPLNTPVSGRATIYLYAADNGLLSSPKLRLTVTAIFSDKTSLSTEVVK